MKKITVMLSLVAIVASALCVSCAQKKTPDEIPAFPANKVATYAPNAENTYSWSYPSANGYTKSNGCGFLINHEDKVSLEYLITPNADWTLEVAGKAKDYVNIRHGYGYKEENHVCAASISGKRGHLETFRFVVLKTPESYEEALECEVKLTILGETMTVATLVLEPKIELQNGGENGDENGDENGGENTEGDGE